MPSLPLSPSRGLRLGMPLFCALIATAAIALGIGAANPSVASAGEWPQILGPDRNGVAKDESIRATLPQDGPPLAWQTPVGSGFAGVAVADGRTILFHRQGNKEIVAALDAFTGKPLWSQDFATAYVPSFVDDNGPRCVPTIADGRIFVYGAQGGLHALEARTGRVLWSRPTHEDFGAPEGYFGAGSSPLVVGKRILVNVGGPKQQAGVVAFDVETGKTSWQSTSELASYSSPVTTQLDGKTVAVFVTRLSVVGVDPESGRVLFQAPFGQRGPTVNGANPVLVDGKVLLTASYGIGAVLGSIAGGKWTPAWSDDETLSSQYATPVVDGPVVYGLHGRQDGGEVFLRCLDVAKHRVLWSKPDFGYGALIRAGERLLAVTTDGDLVLIKADRAKYDELGRAKILSTTTRALPALAAGRLYVRDTRTLKCLDLRP